jgi:hypothetical protein
MFTILIALHSIIRWFVLLSLLYCLYRAWRGRRGDRAYTALDDAARRLTAAIAQIQFLIGLSLYFLSPIVDYFLKNFKEAVHMREIRFFGMEHSLMMFIAVALISIGSQKVGQQVGDQAKFRAMWVWYGIALLVILTSIPWEFSPLVSRPSWRSF